MAQLTAGPLIGQSTLWPVLACTLALLVNLWACAHAVLYKRDTRAAVAWVGFIWVAPILGAVLYGLFGVNRIRRRARSLRPRELREPAAYDGGVCPAGFLTPGGDGRHFQRLAQLVGRVTQRPLLAGNRIQPLVDGCQAYAEMLAAIGEATRSVSLATYIFDNDRAGDRFVQALRAAVARGVAVRVLIDDVGARYSRPSIVWPLCHSGVRVARFLPRWVPWAFPHGNLRCHRKILVVDGRLGFTGGMNIREGYCPEYQPRYPVQDLHCRVEGPVVAHLQEAFADDWEFCTGQRLHGELWFPALAAAGPVFARGITDGPDEDFEKLRLTLLGALACAQHSVRVVTPYFLPDAALITALNIAALRGVVVDILLPARGNLRLIQWASTAQLWQVLERGCRVWLTPPPFDHTKLLLVDGVWALLGSANWDARSLRLNFELNLECYDSALGSLLEGLVQSKLRGAQPLTLADVDNRSLPVRLRDGLARLLSPYL
jgi:cardiolipin synthase